MTHCTEAITLPDYIVDCLEVAARQAQRILKRDYGLSVRFAALRAEGIREAERNAAESGDRHPSAELWDMVADVFRSLLVERAVKAEHEAERAAKVVRSVV